jgi:hypothetical protein
MLLRINPESQEIKLLFNKDNCESNTFIDFSIGDYVTISDGNPNLGSNPTATITDIALTEGYIQLQLYRQTNGERAELTYSLGYKQ